MHKEGGKYGHLNIWIQEFKTEMGSMGKDMELWRVGGVGGRWLRDYASLGELNAEGKKRHTF